MANIKITVMFHRLLR